MTTHRVTGKVISSDPSGLEGDTTTWEYDLATGLELRKTYADGRGTVKTYDAYNNLAIRENGVWYTYGWDLTKNICELYGQEGFIRTIYTYSPYGQVRENESTTQSPRGIGGGLDNAEALPEGRTADGAAVSQPIQWSSEMYDADLGLVYYNFRYYDPRDGRWTRRAPIEEKDRYNLYRFLSSNPLERYDILGRETSTGSCCTVTLYVEPPKAKAVENNVLNVYEDQGHTWVELEYGGETITFSVGPKHPIDPDDATSVIIFLSGKTPGITDFSTGEHRENAVTKEWKLNKIQCETAKKVLKEQTQKNINYSPQYQCTSAALGLLNAIPVSPPPDGRGPVVIKVTDNEGKEKIYWKGNIPNPYHLSVALKAT